jgi:hypothetical protein
MAVLPAGSAIRLSVSVEEILRRPATGLSWPLIDARV